MAAIAGNKKRENIHTDIGFVGRKTGFTIQANLGRDDNGMEDLSAFFSPTSNAGTLPNLADDDDDDDSFAGDFEGDFEEEPESDVDIPSDRAPRTQNVSANDGSASMEMEDSTARSVTAVLESRKGINTPARRKSMHSAHATPNLPLSSVTPQSNLSTPAIRRPKATSKAPSSQLSKPVEQNEETRGSFGSHKENVPNSFDSRQSDDAPVEVPVPRPIPLGARASGFRAAGGRGSGMLVAKGLRTNRPALTPPPLSDDDDDDDDELPKFNEEQTLDDTEMDDIPAPQPKSKPTQRSVAEKEDSAEPTAPEKSNQKGKQGRKGKASVSKTIDEAEHPPVSAISKPDKPAAQKRGRKGKVTTIVEEVLEVEATQADEEVLDTLDAGIPDMETQEAEEIIAAEPSPPKKGRGGRKKKQAGPETETETEPQPSTSENAAQKKRGGRPKKIAEPEPEPEEEHVQEEEPEPEPEPVAQKAKGRPKKSKKQDASVPDHDTEPQEDQPEETTEQPQPENPSDRRRGRKRKADTLIPDTEPGAQESSTATGSAESNAAKKRKGSKQTAAKPATEKSKASKPETTAVAEGRRTARTRTAPLQFWKNEKQVYTVVERDDSGRAIALKPDVIRVSDEPVVQKKKARPSRPVVVSATEKVNKRTTKRKSKAAKKAVEESSSESDGDESEDDWEKVGKLVGMVKPWKGINEGEEEEDDEDDEVEDEIATSRHGIEFKPIFGSDYFFAKTLGKDFMGCGILELKTGASKKLKSSGKMQLVFFVLKGKVEAEVNELGFRISHGGQFQVPRGNMYKISNPFKKTARIFFAQACVPDPSAEKE
ncbi:hypothetical protein TWF481_004296 [Arthrobotrys musiformis]|uniref:CENP-C homolog n=1 Tax=Arthrobotrys musiformis TaxID=47236 RepID=A0AAV9WJ74_9PEZI